MAHYTGKLVYSCWDAEGIIEVVDEAATRSLHFGTQARQTTMFLHDPHALALSYTRCMMTCLLFAEPPRQALVLGMGGGALVRFLLRQFPHCRVETVEKRARVIEVARAFFHLPEEPRLQVFLADAAAFLGADRGEPRDLVLVDLHDSGGMAPLVCRPDFFAVCRQRLRQGGVLAVNLWSGSRDDALKGVMRNLRLHFDHQVLYLPVAGKRNCIGLGLTAPLVPGRLPALQARARELQAETGIDFPLLLGELVRVNPGAFQG